jgi:AcrR family transcriptional regulator
MPAPPRLTRKEKQAATRAALMRSAATVAARRGLERASIDEVAEGAGFTKGAFYANFKSKEELFLAMLDEHFADRLAELDRALASGEEPAEQARRAGVDLMRAIAADPEWERLFFEFTVHAVRDPAFRRELVARQRAMRERVAELLERRVRELGIEPAVAPAQVAAMSFAMVNGVALERLLEPEAVPDELLPTMMAAFFSGLPALAASPPRHAPRKGSSAGAGSP